MSSHTDPRPSPEFHSSRPGRPRLGEEEERRQRVLDAAFAVLIERGYQRTTMLAVARRAGASKETLYSWFGSKQGLFTAMIQRQSAAMNRRLRDSLAGDEDLETTLTALAADMLELLLGERALALNRAAMSEPELAAALLEHGRHATGPLVEEYLAREISQGRLPAVDPAEAFRVFYGLLIQDQQIRALLGDTSLNRAAIDEQARFTVRRFLLLVKAEGDATI